MSTSNWDGISGNWGTGTLWAGGVPSAGSIAEFNSGGTYTVTYNTVGTIASVDGYDQAGSFDLAGGSLVTNDWTWEGDYSQSAGLLIVAGAPAYWSEAFSLSGGTLDLAGGANWATAATQSGGEIILAGASNDFSSGLDQTGGQIQVNAGTLSLDGTASVLNGTLTGAGALSIGAYGQAAVTLGNAAALDIQNTTLSPDGELVLTPGTAGVQNYIYQGNMDAASGSTLDSEGQIFTLDTAGSGTFSGTFAGGGTLDVQGEYALGAALTGTNTALLIDGSAIQAGGQLALGVVSTDQTELQVDQGGTYDLFSDPDVGQAEIYGNSSSILNVLGTLEETGLASGYASQITVETLSLSGVLLVDGALDISGADAAATAVLAGSIGGNGTLELLYQITASIGGASLDVAFLDIGPADYSSPAELLLTAAQSYDGVLLDGDGIIDTNGYVFTLGAANGGTLSNVIDGGGTVLLAGQIDIATPMLTGDGTELLITGEAEEETGQENQIALGETAGDLTLLSIAASGTLNMSDSYGVYGTGTALVNNAGLIELNDTALTGPGLYSTVTFTNSGTVDIAGGAFQLESGSASLGGVIEGPGTLNLIYETVTFLANTQVDAAYLELYGDTIDLTANFSYGGVLQSNTGIFTTINTNGYVLSVASGALNGIVTGGGTVVVTGSVDNGVGNGVELEGTGTTLLDEGTITQNGESGGGSDALAIGQSSSDNTTLSIAHNAVYDITNGTGITSDGPVLGVIENNGLFEADSTIPLLSNAIITIGTFFNQGTIADVSGDLSFQQTNIVNDGIITVADNLNIEGTDVTATGGTQGTFVIESNADLTFQQYVEYTTVASNQTISFASNSGMLTIEDGPDFFGTIDGFQAGDVISWGNAVVNTFSYANNILTLYNLAEISAGEYKKTEVGTLNLPGINPADLEFFPSSNSGDSIDIQLGAPGSANGLYPVDTPSATWLGTGTANWNTSADWSTAQLSGGVPTIATAVTLNASASAYTVDFSQTYTALDLLGGVGSTLDITGGTFQVIYGFSDGGAVSIANGTLELGSATNQILNEYQVIGTLALSAGGVLQVDDGIEYVNNANEGDSSTTNEIAGTLTGLGAIDFGGGTYLVSGSADLAVATLISWADDLQFNANQSFTGAVFENERNIDLNGFGFLLAANTTADISDTSTIYGGGTLTVGGVGYLGGTISGPGTEILITGTAYMGDNPIALGALLPSGVSAAIVVAEGGTFFNPVLQDTVSYTDAAYSGTLINNGLISETAPLGSDPYDSYYNAPIEQVAQFINSATGTLDVAAGAIGLVNGSATLAGLIEGGGTLFFSEENVTLVSGVSLDVAAISLTSAALTLTGAELYSGILIDTAGTINMSGHTLQLSGSGTLSGLLNGGGTAAITGDYLATGLTLSGTGTELLDLGYLAIGTGGLQLGPTVKSTTALSIATQGTLDIVGPGASSNGTQSSSLGVASINNAGLLVLSETGVNGFTASTFINTGTLAAQYSDLQISADNAAIGGVLTGQGEIEIASTGTVVLAATVVLTAATLGLDSGVFQLDGDAAYDGAFIENAPALDTNGYQLDLGAGSTGTLAGAITGGGGVTIGGSMLALNTDLQAAATALDVTGTLQVAGTLYAGSTNATGAGALVAIGTSGVLNIEQDGLLGASGSFSNFTIDNAGLIEKTGDTGVVTIAASSFLNTGTIAADVGTIEIAGTLVNDGTIFEDGLGGVVASGGISGTGKIIIDPATTTLSSSVAAGQLISFTGTGGTLVLADATQFLGTIGGFEAGDVIDLGSFSSSSITGEGFAGGVLTLDAAGGTVALTFANSAGLSSTDFMLSGTGAGTAITTNEQAVVCYLRGTRILTPTGEVPVEQLCIGDTVITKFAGTQSIEWIGRQSFARRFVRNNRNEFPVRIAAGALGTALPRRDLYVSPGHSMLLGEHLVLAKSLVNGITITQTDAPEAIHYYQLEFKTHDCVRAEGAWSESYADCVYLRRIFHNAWEFYRDFPDHVAPVTPMLCAPRPEAGPELEKVLRPVVARAVSSVMSGALCGWVDQITPDGIISGWAQDERNPELPVLLEIFLGEKIILSVLACDYRTDLAEAGIGHGRCSFSVAVQNKIPLEYIELVTVRRADDGMRLPLTNECQAMLSGYLTESSGAENCVTDEQLRAA